MDRSPYDPMPEGVHGRVPSPAAPSGDGTFIAPPLEAERPNVAVGTIAALAVGTLAAAVWVLVVSMTGYQIGFAALAVGWLVGLAAVKGSGGVTNVKLQAIAVTATLAVLAVSEYFVVRAFFVQSLGDIEAQIPLFLPVGDMLAVVGDSVTGDPTTLLFWGLGAYGAYRMTRPAPAPAPVELEA